jgi:hypothetical protein
MIDKKEKSVDRDVQKEVPALVSIDLTTGKVTSNGFDATPNQETGDPHVYIDAKGKE